MLYGLPNYEQNTIPKYFETKQTIITPCKFYVYIRGHQAMILLKRITSTFIRVPFFSTPCTCRRFKK